MLTHITQHTPNKNTSTNQKPKPKQNQIRAWACPHSITLILNFSNPRLYDKEWHVRVAILTLKFLLYTSDLEALIRKSCVLVYLGLFVQDRFKSLLKIHSLNKITTFHQKITTFFDLVVFRQQHECPIFTHLFCYHFRLCDYPSFFAICLKRCSCLYMFFRSQHECRILDPPLFMSTLSSFWLLL